MECLEVQRVGDNLSDFRYLVLQSLARSCVLLRLLHSFSLKKGALKAGAATGIPHLGALSRGEGTLPSIEQCLEPSASCDQQKGGNSMVPFRFFR